MRQVVVAGACSADSHRESATAVVPGEQVAMAAGEPKQNDLGWWITADGTAWWDGARWRPYARLDRDRINGLLLVCGFIAACSIPAVIWVILTYLRSPAASTAAMWAVGLGGLAAPLALVLAWLLVPLVRNHPPRQGAPVTTLLTPGAALTRDLIEWLHFNSSDLRVNGVGVVSRSQRLELLRREAKLLIAILVCLCLIALSAWLLLFTNGGSGRGRGNALILLPVLIGFVIGFSIRARKLLVDILAGRVSVATGTLVKGTGESILAFSFLLTANPAKYDVLELGHLKFRAPARVAHNLPDRFHGRAFYTPRSKQLVAVEVFEPPGHPGP